MRFPGFTTAVLLLTALAAQAEPDGLRISSPDFANGAAIPARFTCGGENVSPTLAIAGVPPAARSLVLIVDDPDAPSGVFTHWVVWNIPPQTKVLPSGKTAGNAIEGTNDFGKGGYSGPCPPSGTHRYFFRLSALDISLNVPPGAARGDIDTAIKGHVIGAAAWMGRYSKTGVR